MQCLSLNLFSGLKEEYGLENASRIDDVTMAEKACEVVPGLSYLPNYITLEEEETYLGEVDRAPWSGHWQRRTQHYGRSYRESLNPKSLADEENGTAFIPYWVHGLRDRLVEDEIFGRPADQMGINEYLPGQGIAGHVDYHGGEVVSITLGAGCVMDFHKIGEPVSASTWLAPRSMVVIKGEARNMWTHGIARRKTDVVNGITIARARRVSLTLRCIV